MRVWYFTTDIADFFWWSMMSVFRKITNILIQFHILRSHHFAALYKSIYRPPKPAGRFLLSTISHRNLIEGDNVLLSFCPRLNAEYGVKLVKPQTDKTAKLTAWVVCINAWNHMLPYPSIGIHQSIIPAISCYPSIHHLSLTFKLRIVSQAVIGRYQTLHTDGHTVAVGLVEIDTKLRWKKDNFDFEVRFIR